MKLSPGLDRLAATQHGLLSTAQLRRQMTSAQLETAVRNGTLITVRRSVYRTAGSGPTWAQAVLAVQLASPALVVSHRSAARLWGLAGCRLVSIDDLTQSFAQLGSGRRGSVALGAVIEEL